MPLFYLSISFLTSLVGAICGIGGGVIIKPTLDLLQLAEPAAISFLSGCTVLSMCAYNVGRSLAAKEKNVDLAVATPLALGAAAGGVVGKQIFSAIKNASPDPVFVGRIQALCLMAVTLVTLVYMLRRKGIRSLHIKKKGLCILIGLLLGLISSFLGIGGGPINLAVFYYFFSMDIKQAAQNTLYTIFFSQTASLITTLVTRTVPDFELQVLGLMILGGFSGGMAGRGLNKKIAAPMVDKLFMALMVAIILISGFNALR